MRRIVAVRKEGSDIVAYKLDDGREVNEIEIMDVILSEGIEGVMPSSRNGIPYVRGINDGDPKNNLGNLPLF